MINHVTLQGRFTKDLELKYNSNNLPYTKFTLAWSEKYGERENSCFLNCVAYKGQANFLTQYFKKGDMILLEGKLITWKYENENGKQWTTELIVENSHFCESKTNKKKEEENDDDVVLPF